MGKGRKRTPTSILRLKGSRHANRPCEPRVEPGEPPRPSWIEGEALSIWRRLVPQLINKNVLTPLDGAALARYCVYAALWMKELSNPLRTEATLERYANQLSRLETAFGLTPSARASLKIDYTDVDEDDPLDALLRRHRGGDAD